MYEQRRKYKDARIIIADSHADNIRLLEGILEEAGYKGYISTTDPREVLSVAATYKPDLILLDVMMLDVMMLDIDGSHVMELLKPLVQENEYLPILVLTDNTSKGAKERALAVGAKDFLTKPLDPMEVLVRTKYLLETRVLHLELQNHNQEVEAEVAQQEILERLASAAEYRDDQTGEHTRRVSELSALLARGLGLPEGYVELLRRTASLHDLGKIAVPDCILLKPGRLTPEEFEIMKTHTTVGAKLLSEGRSMLTRTAECIALTHHERWDGTGYPQGLRGEEIPIEGRIVAVVDVFDALTHERPYKRAWKVGEALDEIKRQSGLQFDPRVVEAFLVAFVQIDPYNYSKDNGDQLVAPWPGSERTPSQ